MRAHHLLATFALLTAMPGALNAMTDNGVPVATRQRTGDAWDIGATTLQAPCQRILSDMAFPTPPALRATAEGALAKVSVVPLTDSQAAALMGRPTSGHLFADLLIEKVTQIQAQKKSSVDDQLTAHDLIQAIAPHYPAYRPYLVRALAGPRILPSNFTIRLCGDTLLVDNTSDGDKASRLPLIVFLQAKPATSIPSWYIGAKEGR